MKFRKAYPVIVCAILFVLVLILRFRILYDFCFLVTDADQLLLWDAANDIHHGIFHEPCFYGQAYNPLVEPLFAQVFLIFGMSLRFALPLVSWIFGFLPFVILGLAFFRDKKYYSVVFTLAYLLWLPIEFHAIDSIPRGYVPACAFAAIGIYLAMFSENRMKFFWFGFLSLIGFTISQNCIFLIIPAAIYFWLHNIKSLKFYLQSFAGLLLAMPLPVFIYWFYATHPAYNVHGIEYTFDFDTFKLAFTHIDQIFNYLSPEKKYQFLTVSVLYFVFAVICFVNKKFISGISIISGFIVLLFTLWFDKAQDVEDNYFFSGVRMYLGVPVSFALFSYWAESSFKSVSNKWIWKSIILTFFLFAGIVCMSQRNRLFKTNLYGAMASTDVVPAEFVDAIIAKSNHLQQLCLAYHSDLVILDNKQVGLGYIIPALNYPFKILRPVYERRTWDMQSEDHIIRPNFILLPDDPEQAEEWQGQGIDIKPTTDPKAFLIATHGKKVFAILKDMKIDVRAH